MSDLQLLILIVWAVYLFESVLWVPNGAIVFRRGLLGPWQVLRRGWELAAFEIQALWGPLFPPFGRTFVCEYPRFHFSTLAFWVNSLVGTEPHPPKRYFPFDSITEIRCSGAKIFCNGQRVARLASPEAARRMAAWLNRLRQRRAGERTELIETEFRRILDAGQVHSVLSRCRELNRTLRWACTVQFALLLIVFPLLALQFGFRTIWLPLVAGVVATSLYIAWKFHRARTVLIPHDPDRASTTATLLLSPVSAVHAVDKLERDAVAVYHPLAVTRVLCSGDVCREEAVRHIRELLFPIPSPAPESMQEQGAAELWYRQHWQKAVERFIAQNIGDPASLLAAPPKESAECLSYCPRCLGQYVFQSGHCAECGLPVFGFDQPTAVPLSPTNTQEIISGQRLPEV